MKNTTFFKTIFVKKEVSRWVSPVCCLLFLLMTGFVSNAQTTVTLGAGTSTSTANTTGAGLGPVNAYYEYMHYQVVYTAAEITAAGGSAGAISQFGWNVSTAPATLPNYKIRMAQTAATNSSTHNATALTEVYSGDYTPSAGYNMFTLPAPFIWDGTSNILVDVCYGAAAFATPYGQVFTYGTDADSSRFSRADGTPQCETTTNLANAWKPQARFVISPPPSCLPITGITMVTNGSDSVTISWNPSGSTPTGGYDYFWSETNTAPTEDTEPSGSVAAGVTQVTISGLNPITQHYLWVRANCGDDDFSTWSAFSFTTLCGVYMPSSEIENFTSFTGAMPNPQCWSEATGTLGTTPAALTGTTGGWSNQSFSNNSGHANGNAVYINLYGLKNEWFISKAFDLGDGSSDYQLEYSALVIPWSGSALVTTMDEKFVKVVISTDGGATWAEANVLKTYGQNNIPATTVNEVILLEGYTGVIKIGFYAGTVDTAEDLRFYVDNFRIREVPSCSAPTALQLEEVGETTATISWTESVTVPEEGYQYYRSDTNVAPVEATEPTGEVGAGVLEAELTGMTVSTSYYVWFRAECEPGLYSEWVGPMSFTTLCDSADILSTTGDSVCGQGIAELSATVSEDGILKWYAAETGGEALGTGTTFTTPLLTETTNYYVSGGNLNPGSDVQMGSGTFADTFAGYSPYYHGYGGTKSQYLYTAAELQAAGIFAGPINSVSFNIVSLGTATLNGFAVSIGTTSQTAATSSHVAGLTPVYSNAAQTLTTGLNTYEFDEPFVWDGTSNIVVQVCWSNNNPGGTSSSTTYSTTSFVSSTYTYSDNVTAEAICGTVTGTPGTNGGTYTDDVRPNITFNATAICESAREMVTATVTDAPDVELSASEMAICNGESTELSVESENEDYTYVWMPGNLAGATHTVSPTETTTYTVTATDETSECIEVGTITVIVNQLPVIGEPLVDMEVCEGSIEALTFNTALATSAVSGTDVTASVAQTTLATLGPNPLQNYYGGAKQQWLYTAEELTAMGFVEGSEITSIALDLATANPALTLNDVSIKMKNVSVTSFASTTAWITDMTTVKPAANHVPSLGWNTFTLTTPFTWDGTSSLAIQMSYSNATSPSAGTNSARYSATTFASTIFYRVDSTAPATLEAYTETATATFNQRNNVTFGVNNPVETTWSPITNLWIDANATTPYVGGNAATVYTKPAAAITYTATATTDAGCSISDQTAITINVIAAPIAAATQTFCNSGTIADLDATGTDVKWYYAANGGNALAGTTQLLDGTVYYASQTLEGCESVARTAVTADITVTDAPSVEEDVQTFCNAATLADIEIDGEGILWYTSMTGGEALEADTDIAEGISIFFASQTVEGCESMSRTAVVVELNITVAPDAEEAQTFCNAATVADLMADGEMIMWYDAEDNMLEADDALVNGGVYYASQTINGCESAEMAMVTVTITAPAAPAGDDTQEFCGAATVADLMLDSEMLTWYDASEGGNMLEADAALENGVMYYASQWVDGCESIGRYGVTVTITTVMVDTPADVTECHSYVLPVLVNGAYYTEANGGGEAVAAGTEITETTTLYVYATGGTEAACTAEHTFTITINTAADPSGEANQSVEINAGEEATIADLVVTTEGEGTVTWYASEEDAANGTDPLSMDSVVTDGTTYYAVFTSGDCTSDSFGVTVDVVLGNKGFDMAAFTYHPNPVRNVLNIAYSSEITSVTVFNLLGQQVIAQQPNATEVKVDMSGLADGTYVINVTSGNAVNTFKVVKHNN